MNQALDGHSAPVMRVAWNPTAKKLTTSDGNGLIIVWMLHKGLWFEEMVNNRKQSVVKDMRWCPDGSKICIAYADGAVIVGSVDGNRVWGKTLPHNLELVAWSPDSRHILFGTDEGTIEVYNGTGDQIGSVLLQPEDGVVVGGSKAVGLGGEAATSTVRICSVDWYDGAEGHEDPSLPTLVVAYENGRLQLMKGWDDESPLLVDTGMVITRAHWNPQGTVLAVAGNNAVAGSSPSAYVQFYDSRGRHLRNLKIPGSGIRELSWEGSGLRLVMAVDSFMYFANVRPPHKWAPMGGGLVAADQAMLSNAASAATVAAAMAANTLPLSVVYAYTKPERVDGGQALVFWNTVTGEKNIQVVPGVEAIHAVGDRVLVVLRASDGDDMTSSGGLSSGLAIASRGAGRFAAYIFDSAGKPLDHRFLDVDPAHCTLTAFHAIIASDDQVFVWQYRSRAPKVSGSSASSELRRSVGKERVFHIDDNLAADGRGAVSRSAESTSVSARSTADPITAIAATTKMLLVGRASGGVQRYTLPHLIHETTYALRGRPTHLAVNCDSTVFGVIDWRANASFFDMQARTKDSATGREVQGIQLERERKDCWDLKWAIDSPTVCAAMEKTKLVVFESLTAEPADPEVNSGYIAYVDSAGVKCVMMDEVISEQDRPSPSAVAEFETSALRQLRKLISESTASEGTTTEGTGLEAAVAFVKDNSHPRLWRLVAEAAMERLDLVTAERALAASFDYAGIQMIKRLRRLPDREKQRAEVAAFFRRFEDAEEIYLGSDRADLAVELRAQLGDWRRVLVLLGQTDPSANKRGAGTEVDTKKGFGVAKGVSGADAITARAHHAIGQDLAVQQEWGLAIPHFTLSNSSEELAECFFHTEDYDGLVHLARSLPAGSPLLRDLAERLQASGLTTQAAEAWVAAGDPKAAIDCCVLQNEWGFAVKLAEEHEYPQIEGLFGKYADHLLSSGDAIAAVELYRKAKREPEAAKLLAKLAEDALGVIDEPLVVGLKASSTAMAGATRVLSSAPPSTAKVELNASANPGRAKKLFVLAALEVERYRKRTLDLKGVTASTVAGGGTATTAATAATLNTLLAQDAATLTTKAGGMTGATTREARRAARTLDQAWRGAEAVHFWMLAQQQLYSGHPAEAMQSATRATMFDDILPPKATYSLLALAAYAAGYMGVSSRAFIRLESLPDDEASEAERDAFRDTAFQIFLRGRPIDPAVPKTECPKCSANVDPWAPLCLSCGANFDGCVATGEPIRSQPYYRCDTCRHKMLLDVAAGRKACALCHAAVSDQQIQTRRQHVSSGTAAGKAAALLE
jgi:WD repeat-containing protein 35